MKKMLLVVSGLLSACLLVITPLYASDATPWGSAKVLEIEYQPNKVLYDLTSGNIEDVTNIINRIAYLNKLYHSDTFDSSIVVIIHGDAIPFFAIKKYKQYRNIMARAQSLTVGTTIEFRMCRAAAKLMHFEPADIHGFVTMVPMADAEITRLQSENICLYALIAQLSNAAIIMTLTRFYDQPLQTPYLKFL